MASAAANSFDQDFSRVARDAKQASSAGERDQNLDRLDRLCDELRRSESVNEGVLDCRTEGECLLIVVHGQRIGEWTQEGCDLTLYRAGSDVPDCQASSVREAVKLTVRLVAAMAQA